MERTVRWLRLRRNVWLPTAAAAVAVALLVGCSGQEPAAPTPAVATEPSSTARAALESHTAPTEITTKAPAEAPARARPTAQDTLSQGEIARTPRSEPSDGAVQRERGEEVVEGEVGAKLDEYLTRITPFGFAGSVLVAKDGEIVFNKGYGMAIRSEGIPNTAETVFSTGSITKQFTAAAIMKLEMQGKLNPESTEGRPWGQPLKKPAGAPLNLG